MSKLVHAAYIASGSPERPTVALLWSTVYAPSLILGIVTGAIVAALSAPNTVKGWALFLGALFIATVALGIAFEGPLEYLRDTFASTGNWFFFAGSAVIPGVLYAKRSAV